MTKPRIYLRHYPALILATLIATIGLILHPTDDESN